MTLTAFRTIIITLLSFLHEYSIRSVQKPYLATISIERYEKVMLQVRAVSEIYFGIFNCLLHLLAMKEYIEVDRLFLED